MISLINVGVYKQIKRKNEVGIYKHTQTLSLLQAPGNLSRVAKWPYQWGTIEFHFYIIHFYTL